MAFSLPGHLPAVLELLDVGGRRMLRCVFQGLGPGRHVMPLGADPPLPSGVYLLRLVYGARTLTGKARVLR